MNPNTEPENELRRLAHRRVKAKLGFYVHALVYLLVNVMLLGVQTSFTPTVHWPLFPALGWGIGLAFHGMAVFLAAPGAALRERMVAEELRNLEARRDAARQR